MITLLEINSYVIIRVNSERERERERERIITRPTPLYGVIYPSVYDIEWQRTSLRHSQPLGWKV